MIPSTATRVSRQTSSYVNEQIRRQTEENVARIAKHGPAAIERRLAELDEEWDIERAIEANSSSLILMGVMLGLGVDRRWFLLPAAVSAFLLQHSVQGWCPPIPLLRRMGFRTATEIDHERYALKCLRGDFANVPTSSEGDGYHRILNAVRR
jgi:hypothetical protein